MCPSPSHPTPISFNFCRKFSTVRKHQIWFLQCSPFLAYDVAYIKNVPKKGASRILRASLGNQIFGPKWSNVAKNFPNTAKRSKITSMPQKSGLPTLPWKFFSFGHSVLQANYSYFFLLSTGGREWAPSSMKAPLLGTECSARRLPAIDFYFRYSYYKVIFIIFYSIILNYLARVLCTQGLLTTVGPGKDFQKKTNFRAQIALTQKRKEILWWVQRQK